MKKYRLQPILEMRAQARRDAARAMAARQEELAVAEAEMCHRERALDQNDARLSAARLHMVSAIDQGTKVNVLIGRREHIADLQRQEKELADEVEQQRGVVAQAEMELERALSALSEASKQLQAIEKHREAWRQRMRRAADQREQKTLDEIAVHSTRQ
jgi:flagellar export protein FliJ